MPFGANQTIRESDFATTSVGAGDSGKVPVLNANGELPGGFLPSQASDVDQSQTTRNAGTAVGEANSTTKKNKLAQSFIPASIRIRGGKLYKDADTGTFTGTVTIALYASSGGSPTGSALATVTIPNATWLLIATGEFEFQFTTEYAAAVVGNLYWLQITTSTSDNSNHPNFGHNTAGGYGSGSVKYNNTTDGWVAIATIDLYFKILFGVLGQVPKTDPSTGLVPLRFLPYSLVEMIVANGSTISGSTATTFVYTKQLPAGFFTPNSGYKITGTFSFAYRVNDAGPTIKFYLNDTVIAQGSLPSNSAGGPSGRVDYELYLINTSMTAQRWIMKLKAHDTDFNITASGQSTSNIGRVSGMRYDDGTSAVDTAPPAIVRVSIENGFNNGSDSFTNEGNMLEKIG